MKNFFIAFVAWLSFVYTSFTEWLRFLFNMNVKPVDTEESTTDPNDFSNANFPVVDITAGAHTPAESINSKLGTPKTPWEDFKNKIKWFPTEQEAFDEWKEKYYPDATATTVEEYRKAWKTFKYQIWGCRVLNIPGLPHDPNFPVLYCIVDCEREVESNRLSDDIRHWYIDYIYQNYTEDEVKSDAEAHLQLAGKEKANWESNVNPTRKTIK